jgi:hypothetical protein
MLSVQVSRLGRGPSRQHIVSSGVSFKDLNSDVNFKKLIPLAPMGVLAHGSAHARPSARPPIDTSGNFPVPMSAESPSNISPNPSEVISEVSEP